MDFPHFHLITKGKPSNRKKLIDRNIEMTWKFFREIPMLEMLDVIERYQTLNET